MGKKLKINLSKFRCLDANRRRELIRRDENPSDGRYEVDSITTRLCVLVGEFVHILKDARHGGPIKCSDIVDFDETVVRLAEHSVNSENIKGLDAYIDVKVKESVTTVNAIDDLDEYMYTAEVNACNVKGLSDMIADKISDIDANDICNLDDFIDDHLSSSNIDADDIDGLGRFIDDHLKGERISADDVTGLERFIDDHIEDRCIDVEAINGLDKHLIYRFDELFNERIDELVNKKLAEKLRAIADSL